MTSNPYALDRTSNNRSAALEPSALDPMDQATQIRKKHLNAEKTVRLFRAVSILGSVLMLMITMGMAVAGYDMINAKALNNEYAARANPETTGYILWGLGIATFLFSIFQLVTAIGFGKLHSNFRTPAFLVIAVWLLYFPIGTILGVYFLGRFRSEEGKYIFTPEYKQIMAQTPQVTSRTNLLLQLLIAGLITLAVIVIIGVLLP